MLVASFIKVSIRQLNAKLFVKPRLLAIAGCFIANITAYIAAISRFIFSKIMSTPHDFQKFFILLNFDTELTFLQAY